MEVFFMLSEFIFYTLVSFFAVYGFVQVVIYIVDFTYDIKTLNDKVIYTVVAVKNEEMRIEQIAKSLLIKSLKNDSGVADNKVVIVDFDSNDRTAEILKLMENDKKGISVMKKEELMEELEKSI